MNETSPPPTSHTGPDAAEVSDRIESLMRVLKLRNRGDIAERLGYSRSQLYAIERGEVPISRKFMISLEALEKAATGSSMTKVIEIAELEDPVVRLLRGLDFTSLCGVAEAGLTKLRQAGKIVPEDLKQLSNAVDEMNRRTSATTKTKHR